MAKIGGLQASVMPIMRIATPFFMLKFLLDLSRIIRDKSRLNYRNETLEFFRRARFQFRALSSAIDTLKVKEEDKAEVKAIKFQILKALKDGREFQKTHGFKNQIDYFKINEKVRVEE